MKMTPEGNTTKNSETSIRTKILCTSTKDELTEAQIQKQITDYLKVRQVFFWIDQQPKMKMKHLRDAGISDIFAIVKGVPWAIEVKTPKGVVSYKQWQFLEGFRKAGGQVLVASSVEQVMEALR